MLTSRKSVYIVNICKNTGERGRTRPVQISPLLLSWHFSHHSSDFFFSLKIDLYQGVYPSLSQKMIPWNSAKEIDLMVWQRRKIRLALQRHLIRIRNKVKALVMHVCYCCSSVSFKILLVMAAWGKNGEVSHKQCWLTFKHLK